MPNFFNASEQPVVINDDSQQVGGGEWFESKLTSQIVAALERGDIVKVDSGNEKEYDSVESKSTTKTASKK